MCLKKVKEAHTRLPSNENETAVYSILLRCYIVYVLFLCLCSASSTRLSTLLSAVLRSRAAAPLLRNVGARRCRSICPARTALSSKPAARRCCGRMTGQTDGRIAVSFNVYTVEPRIDSLVDAHFQSLHPSLLCNSLPSNIQSSPSLPVFRQRLKTFLFRQYFPKIVL